MAKDRVCVGRGREMFDLGGILMKVPEQIRFFLALVGW